MLVACFWSVEDVLDFLHYKVHIYNFSKIKVIHSKSFILSLTFSKSGRKRAGGGGGGRSKLTLSTDFFLPPTMFGGGVFGCGGEGRFVCC